MEKRNLWGNKLKERREELHLTQKQVAKKVGIAESAYQRYERTTIPNAITAVKIARALNTLTEVLYDD